MPVRADAPRITAATSVIYPKISSPAVRSDKLHYGQHSFVKPKKG